jgi:ABC-2 type transport system permease protein
MNWVKIVVITRKNLLEILREPVVLAFSLLLPAFFMALNFVSYGTSPKTATYTIWIIPQTPEAAPYIDKLKAEHYADGRPAFAVKISDDFQTAEMALKDQSAAALLVFSQDVNGKMQVALRGDSLNMAYTKASVQLEAVILPMLQKAQGRLPRLVFSDRPLSLVRPLNDFDAYAPGMMVFAILLLMPQTAVLLGHELRWGTLRRLQLSPLRPVELFTGVCLARMVVAVLQVAVLFGAALLFGFHNRGSLLLAMGIGIVLSFGSIGMGLLLAGFIQNDTDALNTGSAFSMVQVFLSGAFFAMPMPTIFTLFGHQVSAFDFLPATHGMLALQQVLSGGAGLGQVGFRLAAALVTSTFYFALGVWIFSIRQHTFK